MDQLDIIICKLQENGFTVNPLKFEWAVIETNWLGYWLTPHGLKPWKKKIDSILHMDRSKTSTSLRAFIGCINYYRDMWPSRAHVLKTFTKLSGMKRRATIIWTLELDDVFKKIKRLMAAYALSAYPYHNQRFDIFTDASDYQLGAYIIQNGRPVAYFTKN